MGGDTLSPVGEGPVGDRATQAHRGVSRREQLFLCFHSETKEKEGWTQDLGIIQSN